MRTQLLKFLLILFTISSCTNEEVVLFDKLRKYDESGRIIEDYYLVQDLPSDSSSMRQFLHEFYLEYNLNFYPDSLKYSRFFFKQHDCSVLDYIFDDCTKYKNEENTDIWGKDFLGEIYWIRNSEVKFKVNCGDYLHLDCE